MSPAQPELPRRQVDLPTGPGSAPGAGPSMPATPGPVSTAPAKAAVVDAGSKRLIVGQGIRLSGEITACDRLVVEGTVEVTLNETRAVEIAETGRFTGGCEVEEAEISGIYEGELTVRNRLLIRSTGRVKGTVRYGEIEVERGGRLSGSVSQLEPAASA
jgi:cytoskeletal protein CcmA (bactofilin family)